MSVRDPSRADGSGGDEPGAAEESDATQVGEESTSTPIASDRRPMVAGAVIGRYRLRGELGRGGQGSVWAAIDTELGRDVALKLVHGRGDDAARARLLREARALAQLQHPNVVQIFDAFVEGDELVLAMELVAGCDLAVWARTRRPTLARRLDVLAAAGRAIVAAHEAGLVHRDFKPSNVLIADDGRVVVTDFGLVRQSATTGGDPMNASFTTDPRTRLGTLGYMAPEQVLGDSVDAAADQFAFCVVMYELLHERRLFAGSDFGGVASAMALRRGRLPRGSVPRRIAAIIERGLDPDPRARFSSMSTLLAALASARRSRLRIVATIVVASLVAGLIVVGRPPIEPSAALSPWVSSIHDLALAHAEDAAASERADVLAPLVAAMQQGHVGEAEALARTVLASAPADRDPVLRDEAEEWLGRAENALGRRADAERTLEGVVLRASERGDFRRVAGASLALVETIGIGAGRADEAMEWARRAEVAADRAGIDIEAPLEERRGGISYGRGDYDDAEVRLLRVLEIAEESDENAAKLASIYNSLGAIHGSREEFTIALEYFERAREVRSAVAPEDHPEVLQVRVNVGRALAELQRGEEALAELRDVIATSQRSLGPTHPITVHATSSLASAHATLHEYDAAAPHYRRALAVMDTGPWPVSDRIDLLSELTDCELALGDRRSAERSAARAVTLAETAEVRPPVAAGAHLSYARAAAAGHRRVAAVRAAERALAILRAGDEPDPRKETAARELLAELGVRPSP